ncbi:MAG: DNA polymerase III subunit delta' [Proteobacteria bacterium]|nr:DNA polymerase III subunit delta' [Pseudomonadota bacterium]
MAAGAEADIDERHPRFAESLVGHEDAEQHLLRAYSSGRLPHGWLIAGPKGIGKATLAYRFARFLLAEQERGGGDAGLFRDSTQPDSLDVDPESHTARMMIQAGHPGLRVVERSWDEKNKRLRSDILVYDVRRLHGFFGMTASAGGWRVAIVDAADEMNRQAANALLKMLEEPPVKSVLLLVAHAPGQLLPTLRSRCQRLTLRPLEDLDVLTVLAKQGVTTPDADAEIVAVLSAGSPGRALGLIEGGGVDLYRDLIKLFAALPSVDPRALHNLGDRVSGKGGTDTFRLMSDIMDGLLKRFIAFKATSGAEKGLDQAETALFAKLADRGNLEQWIEVWENTARLFGRAEAINLDPKQVTITTFTRLETLTAN